MFTELEITEKLEMVLDEGRVSQHPYSGFDYIQSWDAINTANQIFGFMNWSSRIDELSLIGVTETEKHDKPMYEVYYRATVTITVDYIDADGNARQSFRQGSGTGTGNAKKLSDAHEGALKEAESDAEKRALRKFGDQFGLCLYNKDRVSSIEVESTLAKDELATLLNSWMDELLCEDDIEHNPFTEYKNVGELIDKIKPNPEMLKEFRVNYKSSLDKKKEEFAKESGDEN